MYAANARVAPEHPHPAALHDAVVVYEALLLLSPWVDLPMDDPALKRSR